MIVIGGPNGAGKTTFAKEFLTNEGNCLRFLNTDEIARGLSPLDSSLSQRKAGRLLLDETRRLIGEYVDFALESTLSGKTQAKIIQSARNHHYHISLYYLWLPSAEESEKRVEQRVHEGGHDVPVHAIHRRFPRSYFNFFDLYLPLADTWSLWDASQLPAQCVGSSVSTDVNQLRLRYAISTAKLPTEEGWEDLPEIPESEMPEWLLGAKRAMERATEKELERKRKLGYKIVIWKDRRVQVVDP